MSHYLITVVNHCPNRMANCAKRWAVFSVV